MLRSERNELNHYFILSVLCDDVDGSSIYDIIDTVDRLVDGYIGFGDVEERFGDISSLVHEEFIGP